MMNIISCVFWVSLSYVCVSFFYNILKMAMESDEEQDYIEPLDMEDMDLETE